MWFVSHVLLCETRAALRERLPLAASHALLYTSSADGFPGSHGPYVFSVSFNACTPTPCSSNEVCVVYFLWLSSSKGFDLGRQSLTLSARTILNTTCSFPGMLVLPLGSVEVSTCSVFNPAVTNFSYLTTRHPLSMGGGG